jgi:hypothetical protein
LALKQKVKRLLDKTTVDERLAGHARRIAAGTTVDDKLVSAARQMKQEIRKNIAKSVLAAFGFMIALVWRDVVKEAVTRLVETLSLNGDGYVFTLVTAVVTTVICVAGIIYFSRWSEKQ